MAVARADAERRLDEVLDDYEFFRRQGTPVAIAAAGVREFVLDLCTDAEELEDMREAVRELEHERDDIEREVRTLRKELDEK